MRAVLPLGERARGVSAWRSLSSQDGYFGDRRPGRSGSSHHKVLSEIARFEHGANPAGRCSPSDRWTLAWQPAGRCRMGWQNGNDVHDGHSRALRAVRRRWANLQRALDLHCERTASFDPVHRQSALERIRQGLQAIRNLSGRIENPESWRTVNTLDDELGAGIVPRPRSIRKTSNEHLDYSHKGVRVPPIYLFVTERIRDVPGVSCRMK
jgi:hypothetical protein